MKSSNTMLRWIWYGINNKTWYDWYKRLIKCLICVQSLCKFVLIFIFLSCKESYKVLTHLSHDALGSVCSEVVRILSAQQCVVPVLASLLLSQTGTGTSDSGARRWTGWGWWSRSPLLGLSGPKRKWIRAAAHFVSRESIHRYTMIVCTSALSPGCRSRYFKFGCCKYVFPGRGVHW